MQSAKNIITKYEEVVQRYNSVFFKSKKTKKEKSEKGPLKCALEFAEEKMDKVTIKFAAGIETNYHFGSYPNVEAFVNNRRFCSTWYEILPVLLPRCMYIDLDFILENIIRDPSDPDWSVERIVEYNITRYIEEAEDIYGKELDKDKQMCCATGKSDSRTCAGYIKESYHAKLMWGVMNHFQSKYLNDTVHERLVARKNYYTMWIDVDGKTKTIIDSAPYTSNQSWRCVYSHKIPKDDKADVRPLIPLPGYSKNFRDHLVGIYDEATLKKIQIVQADIEHAVSRSVRRKVYNVSQKTYEDESSVSESAIKIPYPLLKSVAESFPNDRVESHAAWIRTGFGLYTVSYAAGYHDKGLELFHDISKKSSKYDASAVDALWSSTKYRPDCINWPCLRSWFWKADQKKYNELQKGEYREFLNWIDINSLRDQYIPDLKSVRDRTYSFLEYSEPRVRFFGDDQARLVFISSDMGTGKTFQLVRVILQIIRAGSGAKIMIITPRRSFTTNLIGIINSEIRQAAELEGFKPVYVSDYRNPDRVYFQEDSTPEEDDDSDEETDVTNMKDRGSLPDLSGVQFLAISPQSLWRAEGVIFDRVIMDESEAVLGEWSSSTMKKLGVCSRVYESIMNDAEKIYMIDALPTMKTFNHLDRIKNGSTVSCHFNHPQADRPHKLAIPIMANCAKRKQGILARAVIAKLKQGKRVVISSTNQRYARRLYEKILSKCGSKQCMIYDSGTDKKIKDRHFADVNRYWSMYDIVIYTPSVSVGVSFDIPDHFDVLFLYATNTSCTMADIFQGLARVRKFREPFMYYALDCDGPRPVNLPLTYEGVLSSVKAHGALTEKYLGSDTSRPEMPPDATNVLGVFLNDFDDLSEDELDNELVQIRMMQHLKRLKVMRKLQKVPEWLLDAHVRNTWAQNITRSPEAFSKVFEDFCAMTGWTIQGSLTEEDVAAWEAEHGSPPDSNAVLNVECDSYEKIKDIAGERYQYLKIKKLRGQANNKDLLEIEKHWFDTKVALNCESTSEQRQAVFDIMMNDKDKKRLLYNKYLETTKDVEEVIDETLKYNQFKEMFNGTPLILHLMREICQVLGLKNTHDTSVVIPDSLLEQHESELQRLLLDLTSEMKIRVTHNKICGAAKTRRMISNVLYAFSNSHWKTMGKQTSRGGRRVYESTIELKDPFMTSLIDLLKIA